MKCLLHSLCGLLVTLQVVGCHSVKEELVTEGPISALVERLNSDLSGFWRNGTYPIIDLPSDASHKLVIDQAVEKAGFDKEIKSYRILEVRKVTLRAIPGGNYSGALLETDLGTKVLLFNYEAKSWWTRFYDVPIIIKAEPIT